MVNLDEQRHEKLRKEPERSCSESVPHKHLIKGICHLWRKAHSRAEHPLVLGLTFVLLLLVPEHAFWFY